MNTKQIILSVVIVAVVIIGIFVARNYKTNNVVSPTVSPQSSESPSPASSISPTSKPSISPISDIAPKCQLTGEIVFDGMAFQHTGAQEFNYQNVLDPQDIIKWQISPAGEKFDIGPNRISGLTPVRGSDYLTVSFNGVTPKYKKYELSASIDYVAVVDNAAKILNAKCSGKTTLTIK